MAATPSIRWYRVTPDRFVAGLLLAECLFWLSERYRWFPINQHKGWTVLIAAAFLATMALVMLLWLATALVFRLRFQFTIRSMLVLTAVVAMRCSWLAVEVRAAKRQGEAGARLIDGGYGYALYDFQHKDGPVTASGRPLEPEWLRNRLSDDFFAEVDVVSLWEISDADLERFALSVDFPALRDVCVISPKITDAGLKFLPREATIQSLALQQTQITDNFLKHLEEYPQLQELVIADTRISDSSVVYIKVLKKLRSLSLDGTGVTDASIEHLLDLPELRELGLSDTLISDVGLARITQIRKLKCLAISSTKVTDSGLEHLADLPELRELYLDGTSISDIGLARLAQLPKLQVLEVNGTEITDAGIKDLLRMTQLCKLDLQNTKVTAEGLAKLKSGLPNCEILP